MGEDPNKFYNIQRRFLSRSILKVVYIKNQTIVIGAIIVIALLIVGAFYTGQVNLLSGNNYGTGLSINTVAVYNVQNKPEEYGKGKTYLSQPTETIAGLTVTRQPLVKDKYIVSWMPNELSELITLRADFKYNFLPMGVGPGGVLGQVATELLSCYYVVVKYVDINGTEITVIDTKVGVNANHDLWDTRYIEMVKDRFPPDSRHIDDQGFQFPGAIYAKAQGQGIWIGERIGRDATVNSMTFANSYYRVGFDFSSSDWYKHPEMTMPTDTFEFHMKGLRTGALKVTYGVTTAYLQQDGLVGWHGTWHYRVVDNVITDACYLASGSGDVNIKSTGYIPGSPLQEAEQKEMQDISSGTTTWGNWYTKYVFEENAIVKIGVKTGWSGASLNPGDDGYNDPWTLAIYNGKGLQVKELRVPDNFNGDVSYTIPSGSFVAGGNNEWKVVLKNTLFDQAEVVLFVVDSLKKIPGPVTATLDKDQYVEGDTMTVSLVAMANPNGTREIKEFWLDVKYGSTSSVYRVSGFPKTLTAVKKTGTNLTYTATYTFPLENMRPVTLDKLYVRAHAIDKDGRAGIEGEKIGVYVEQKVPQNNPNVDLLGNGIDPLIIYAIIAIALVGVGSYAYLRYGGKKPQKIFTKKRGRK